MKHWKAFYGCLFSLLFAPLAFAAGSPAGTWTTIDDATGQKRAVVSINVSGGTLSATIVKVFPQPGDTGICSKCPGGFKGKKIQGIQFVWGLKDKGNGVWDGGQILDPKSGKVYRAKMTLEGNKLYVRGYVGVSALGRTQVWVR
ncbi:hypothetical protein BN59_03104 [Legionella massiliensis]|uniref:DUF2147 domain-containing protein n=1 Tax=Legionella massiliensis TaxID=1034943 RepID=A0A078KWE7_9GAMM|nr:DUF2147 domain-containing protein [Legionella massiliensis]CDZ78790.1 hypothetical protein BN59_03104 [Legionella massiliensis]CEE14528.1 hypothetical protein BN1094_03104 [Legionella massiliensis]